jgi:hypothetical protein
VVHGNRGPGHTGARKFARCLPALRWQNPEAAIAVRWEAPPADVAKAPRPQASVVRLEWLDGRTSELQVGGVRAEQILSQVLREAGAADDEAVARAAAWAASLAAEGGGAAECAAAHDAAAGDTDSAAEGEGPR